MLAAVAGLIPSSVASCSPSDTRHSARAETPREQRDYVVDQAGVLSSTERQKLTAQLSRFERDTHHQFVVVTVTTLRGEDIAVFTRRLANKWGVGRKGINDGIVILVAPRDRKARIAVGYGLEARLPNAFCQQVMVRKMIPAFAQGQIGAGIEAGVSAIMDRLSAPGRDTR